MNKNELKENNVIIVYSKGKGSNQQFVNFSVSNHRDLLTI